jgi:fructuronate reductase
MNLTWEGLKDRKAWEEAGIALPAYQPEKAAEEGNKNPAWLHFGIGNIFRIFIGSIADRLLEEGEMDGGIICAETFDMDVVDRIYRPFDNLALAVTLHGDGRIVKKVLAPFASAVKAQAAFPKDWEKLKEVFRSPSLQMVSFTITEKGYALRGADGAYLGYVRSDLEKGPAAPAGAMGVVTSMLYERYRAGAYPIALVSMDNVSKNGLKLRSSVLETAEKWAGKGFVEPDFIAYLEDEGRVAFPWTMIDKITPRPEQEIADLLRRDGVRDMDPVITSKKTYIAPFANAEEIQYLVVEDSFPNGRPPLEKGGVYVTDRLTVNKSERMKVTVCLNPIHTALAPYGCVLGFTNFADEMTDPELSALARTVGLKEGMPVVQDPGILSPEAFIQECLTVRFPNRYLGDTPQRIAVDTSQMLAIRFGETIRAYMEKEGTAAGLTGIPLAIAGWLRYLLAITDDGKTFELSPDPMNGELQAALAGVTIGTDCDLHGILAPILSNSHIFGTDLYEAGLGEKIEAMFADEIRGPGAVRETLKKYLACGA